MKDRLELIGTVLLLVIAVGLSVWVGATKLAPEPETLIVEKEVVVVKTVTEEVTVEKEVGIQWKDVYFNEVEGDDPIWTGEQYLIRASLVDYAYDGDYTILVIYIEDIDMTIPVNTFGHPTDLKAGGIYEFRGTFILTEHSFIVFDYTLVGTSDLYKSPIRTDEKKA